MTDWAWKGLQIVAWLLMAAAWYFSDTSSLKERVAIAETRIEQETRGYSVLQAELGRRLERVEDKLDRVLNQRRGQ